MPPSMQRLEPDEAEAAIVKKPRASRKERVQPAKAAAPQGMPRAGPAVACIAVLICAEGRIRTKILNARRSSALYGRFMVRMAALPSTLSA